MQPIIKEIIAENKTAEADMSLTFFIVKSKVGQTRSHNFSIAELIISRLKTTAKQIKITSHSALLIENEIPKTTTNIEITNCTWKFFS